MTPLPTGAQQQAYARKKLGDLDVARLAQFDGTTKTVKMDHCARTCPR
jgi:hypothetical protein